MLRRLIWWACLILAGTVWGATDINTASQFMARLRLKTGLYDTVLVPDTLLVRLTHEACFTVSTDVGGYQKRFHLHTVADRAFYALQDSIVEILWGTVISGKNTKSIKAWYPQYWEDIGGPENLGEETGDQAVPGAFVRCAGGDSVQFIPIPIQADTVYFECLYEHPLIDSSADSIYLKPAYTMLAVDLAQSLLYYAVKDYDQGATWGSIYEKEAKTLVVKYTPKFDQPVVKQ